MYDFGLLFALLPLLSERSSSIDNPIFRPDFAVVTP
jgi:hypothetical protein